MRRIGDTFGESSLAESACGESEARPLGIFENLDLGPSFGTAFFFQTALILAAFSTCCEPSIRTLLQRFFFRLIDRLFAIGGLVAFRYTTFPHIFPRIKCQKRKRAATVFNGRPLRITKRPEVLANGTPFSVPMYRPRSGRRQSSAVPNRQASIWGRQIYPPAAAATP